VPGKLAFALILSLTFVLGLTVTVVGWAHASDPIKGALIALSGTIFTATVTVLGWYGAYTYAKQKEDRARQLEIRLKYRAQQIGELYGPLASLIEQIFNVWTVRENILGHTAYSPEDDARVKEFVWQRYFKPLHNEIALLLRTKLYLLEGDVLPNSFRAYLEHSTQEDCQHLLWSELSLGTSQVPAKAWPDDFYENVKSQLVALIRDHRSGVEQH
jgi:hypothetical protein